MSLPYTAVKGISLVTGLVAAIIFTRELGPDLYSTYLSFFIIIEVAFCFSQVGISTLYVNNFKDHNLRLGLSNLCYLLPLFPISLIGIYTSLNKFGSIELLSIIILTCARSVETFGTLYRSHLEYNERFLLTAVAEFIVKIIALCLTIPLLLTGMGVISILLRDSINMIFLSVIYAYFFPHEKLQPSKIAKLGTIKIQLVHFLFLRILASLQKNTANLALVGTLDLSYFERSQYLARSLHSIVAPMIQKVLFVSFSKNSRKRSASVFYIMSIIFLVTLLIVWFPIFYFSEYIILLIFGDEWLIIDNFFKIFSVLIILLPFRALGEYYVLSQSLISKLTRIKVICLFIILIGAVLYKLEFYELVDFSFIFVISIALNSILVWLMAVRRLYNEQD